MILKIEITNLSNNPKTYSAYTNLETSLKTSHTYKLKDQAWTEYDNDLKTLFTNFNDPETQNTSVFVSNAGDSPESYSGKSLNKDVTSTQELIIPGFNFILDNQVIPENKKSIPAVRFIYKKNLKQNEKLTVVQIIGSCRQDERKSLTGYLKENFQREIDAYEAYILAEINKDILLREILLSTNQLPGQKLYLRLTGIISTEPFSPCPVPLNIISILPMMCFLQI